MVNVTGTIILQFKHSLFETDRENSTFASHTLHTRPWPFLSLYIVMLDM